MTDEVATYTTEQLLIRLGQEVVRTRKAAQLVAVFTAVQAVFLALWVFGLVTIEFQPI